MITSRTQLKFYITADAIMNAQVFPKSRLKKILFPNLIEKYLRNMRFAEYYKFKQEHSIIYRPFYILHRIIHERLCTKTGFDIPIGTLGYGCRIGHLSSIIINGNTKVGNYCCLSNNIVFADSNIKEIGNDVSIGSNVVIAKEISIADGCKISSCSLLNQCALNPKMLWGGVPAREIKETKPWTEEEPYRTAKLQCEILRIKNFA